MPKFKNLLGPHRHQAYSTLDEDLGTLRLDQSDGTQPAQTESLQNIWNGFELLQKRVTGWLEFDTILVPVDPSQEFEISGKLHLDFDQECGLTEENTSEFDTIGDDHTSAINGILICFEQNSGIYLKNYKVFETFNTLQHEEWANSYIPWNRDLEAAFCQSAKNWTEQFVFKTSKTLPASMNDSIFNISYQVTAYCVSRVPEPVAKFSRLLRNQFNFQIANEKLILEKGFGQIMDSSKIIHLDHPIGITGKLKLSLPKSEYLFGETISFQLCIYTFLVNKFATKTIKLELIQRLCKRIRKFEEVHDHVLGTVTKLIEEDLQKGKEWTWEDELVILSEGLQPTLRFSSFEFRHFLRLTLFNNGGEVAYKSETTLILGTVKKTLERNDEDACALVGGQLQLEFPTTESEKQALVDEFNNGDMLSNDFQAKNLRKRV